MRRWPAGVRTQSSAQLQGHAQGAWQTTSEVTCQSATPNVAGVLYVGDAQGTIEPVAGQGMTLAMGMPALAANLFDQHRPAEVDHIVQCVTKPIGKQRSPDRPTQVVG